jgi:putative transposase
MAQNTVFGQIVKLIPRSQFESIVARHQGNKHIRKLDCWSWFGALLFGQLTGHDSIRAIERVFATSDRSMCKLGFGPVRRSTLAEANQNRSAAILQDLFHFVLDRARSLIPRKTGFRFQGPVFALDATVIELCLSLCPWAQFHHNKGAAKLHTAIDLAGDLPVFAVVTHGRVHEVKVARQNILWPRGAMVVFDRGFMDYGFLNDLNQKGIFFVTRAKSNCQFKVLESHPTNRTRGHICDQTIYLKSLRGQRYQGVLRRIRYKDPDTGKTLVFLTNRFDLATQTICDLYKARWRVENFFKTLKQYLRIKKFLGTSVNAVKSQILVAMIAYLLVQLLRHLHHTNISIPDAMAVIGTLLLLKEPIMRLLGHLPRTTRYPPTSQLSLHF